MSILPRNIQALACCAGACLQSSFCTWGNFNRRKWGIFNRRKLGNIQPALTVWTYFARSLRALLHIAARYRSGLAADGDDWGLIRTAPSSMKYEKGGPIDIWNPLVLGGEEAWMAMIHFVRKGSRDRVMWLRLLNCLLALGRVRPWIICEGPAKETRPSLVFSGPNLLSYLALQVCLVAAKQDGFAMCSYCQKPYVPRRAPKSGQRAYCKECRDAGVSVRVAQRNRRARLREDQ